MKGFWNDLNVSRNSKLSKKHHALNSLTTKSEFIHFQGIGPKKTNNEWVSILLMHKATIFTFTAKNAWFSYVVLKSYGVQYVSYQQNILLHAVYAVKPLWASHSWFHMEIISSHLVILLQVHFEIKLNSIFKKKHHLENWSAQSGDQKEVSLEIGGLKSELVGAFPLFSKI